MKPIVVELTDDYLKSMYASSFREAVSDRVRVQARDLTHQMAGQVFNQTRYTYQVYHQVVNQITTNAGLLLAR